MKVPTHKIIASAIKAVASEELQAEIDEELKTTKAEDTEEKDIAAIIADASEEEEDLEEETEPEVEVEDEDEEAND